MPCPVCKEKERSLVSVTLQAGDKTLVMHSCSACETKWWEQDSSPVDLATVLEAARRSPLHSSNLT